MYQEKTKLDLVLVHSFPTNSILLNGLKEFLSDFFIVHFIDLPGFHKSSPALEGKILLEAFSSYLDKKISELDIKENYIIGGISFGFLVVNNAKLNEKCKTILAIEPFISTDHLNVRFWQRIIYILIISFFKLINHTRLGKKVWFSDFFANFLIKNLNYPKERVQIIIDHFDPKTFFSVAYILLTHKEKSNFHNIPHFLIANPKDETINFKNVYKTFLESIKKLEIITVDIEHFPKNPTKEYFRTHLPNDFITKILNNIEK